MPLTNNLFNRFFFRVVLFIIIAELLSFWAVGVYRLATGGHEIVNQIFFLIVCAVVFGVALWRLEYGFYIMVLELFIGSKGHLLYFSLNDFNFSIRLGIFLMVFLAWFILIIKNRKTGFFKNFAKWPLILMITIVIAAFLNALIQHNKLSTIFLDGNSWLFFGAAVVFIDVIQTREIIGNVVRILIASALMISIKTLTLLYLFSHQFAFLGNFYRWVRDSGVGEITYVSNNLFRIFFQSQIWVLFAFLIILALVMNFTRSDFYKKSTWFLLAILILCFATILVNLSRSNWLGLIVGIVILLFIFIVKGRFNLKRLAISVSLIIILGVLSVGLVGVILYFPFPTVSSTMATDLIKYRFSTDNAGITSRLNQLAPLMQEIKKQPLIGYGWGKTVFYKTTDPRYLAEHPDGLRETYMFEMGYFDLWMKIGLIGLGIYGYLIWRIVKHGWIEMNMRLENEENNLIIGLIASLSALGTIHFFSPYLNHPLGIGLIILSLAIINCFFQINCPNSIKK